jgi:hypothetical protein
VFCSFHSTMLRLCPYLGLWILTTLVPSAYANLVPGLQRRDDGYEAAVCYPTVVPGNPLPPCVLIANQVNTCKPPSNSPSGFLSAQSCLCNSRFFSDWVGCQDCLVYHGLESENWYNAWVTEIASVSRAYCTGTPTAYFPTIFSSMTYSMPSVVSEASSDKAPGQTDINLYYTPAGADQGSSPSTSECPSFSQRNYLFLSRTKTNMK